MNILVINAGSTSLKFGVFDAEARATASAGSLALPALPSERLPEACEDKEIVVRAIRTSGHGIYVAVVNTGFVTKPSVRIRLPGVGMVNDAVSGDTVPTRDGILELALHACQLRSLRVR